MNSSQLNNPWDSDPDQDPMAHEKDPADKPPQQNPDEPVSSDSDVPDVAFLPRELDPAAPDRVERVD